MLHLVHERIYLVLVTMDPDWSLCWQSKAVAHATKLLLVLDSPPLILVTHFHPLIRDYHQGVASLDWWWKSLEPSQPQTCFVPDHLDPSASAVHGSTLAFAQLDEAPS